MVVLHCFVVYCYIFFSQGLFITLHASFCRAAFWGQGVCLSSYHSSIILLAGSRGPVEKRREEGGGVPTVPTLWPLTAPSNERRHSYNDMLTPYWSPFLPLLLRYSFLHSPSFLAVIQHMPCTRECLRLLPCTDSDSVSSPPLVSSVSRFLTSSLPRVPRSCFHLLFLSALHSLLKTTLK